MNISSQYAGDYISVLVFFYGIDAEKHILLGVSMYYDAENDTFTITNEDLLATDGEE